MLFYKLAERDPNIYGLEGAIGGALLGHVVGAPLANYIRHRPNRMIAKGVALPLLQEAEKSAKQWSRLPKYVLPGLLALASGSYTYNLAKELNNKDAIL